MIIIGKASEIRRLAGVSWPAPIAIVAGDDPPALLGEPGHWTTPSGRPVLRPKAYARKAGWRSVQYHKSTQRVAVGVLWLRAQPDLADAWYDGPRVCEAMRVSEVPLRLQPRGDGLYAYVARYHAGESWGYLLRCGDVVHHWGYPMAVVARARRYAVNKVDGDPIQRLKNEGVSVLADIADSHVNAPFYAAGLPRGLYRQIVTAFKTLDGDIIAVADRVKFERYVHTASGWAQLPWEHYKFRAEFGTVTIEAPNIYVNWLRVDPRLYVALWTQPELVALAYAHGAVL